MSKSVSLTAGNRTPNSFYSLITGEGSARVQRVIEVPGMVNAGPNFGNHTSIINGVSDLIVELFGDAGRATR